NVQDFTQLDLLPEQMNDENASQIYDWLVEVSATFNQGLQMDERRITGEQREEFKPWLQQVFTPELTNSLLEEHVPQVQGGYIVAGFLDMIPPLGPHTKENHRLAPDEDSYTYSVQLKGGMNSVKVTCTLMYEDSQWKIDRYLHEY